MGLTPLQNYTLINTLISRQCMTGTRLSKRKTVATYTSHLSETECIFVLSKDNLHIAKAEIEELLHINPTGVVLQDHYYFAKVSPTVFPLIERLAYTHACFRIIEKFDAAGFDRAKKLTAQLPDIESYKVVFLQSANNVPLVTRKKSFGIIYDTFTAPKVSLNNPQKIFGVLYDNPTAPMSIWFCECIYDNDKSYMDRRAHLRPKLHPSALSPKLAKAMVNLTSVRSGVIYDPFCGTGGMLIEAMHNGLQAIGSDIDRKMIHHARINIASEIKTHPHLASVAPKIPDELFVMSALETPHCADGIVCDVPYGRNTKKVNDHAKLYYDFLMHVEKNNLCERVSICLPHFAKGRDIIAKTSFRIKHMFTFYIHRSLSREVFILERVN